jgi:nicotinate phosphoribosyltransferase
VGIRLDSGDLAYLSVEARKLLDAAGFPRAVIVASNDLDETIVASLAQQGAAIDQWGIGTKLVTGHPDGALGGVYKLSATRAVGQPWRYPIKISEQRIKISTPGRLQVRRYGPPTRMVADLIYDLERGVPAAATLVDPLDESRRRVMAAQEPSDDLLVPVLRGGQLVAPLPPLAEARARAATDLARLHVGARRLLNPHQYPVGLEQGLATFKAELVLAARRGRRTEEGTA